MRKHSRMRRPEPAPPAFLLRHALARAASSTIWPDESHHGPPRRAMTGFQSLRYGAPTAVATDWNVPLRFTPTSCTAAMMTTAMPAAIRPYSIAVAPLSLCRKLTRRFFMTALADYPISRGPLTARCEGD